MKDILQKIDALEGTAPPTLRGKDTLKPMSKPGKYGEPHPTKGKFVGGESADTDSESMMGKLCTKCKKGTYQETSIHDDWDGVIHCTQCGHEVKTHPDKVNEADLEEEKIYSKMKKDFLDFLKAPEKKSDKFKSDDAIDAVDNDELKEAAEIGDYQYKGYTYWGQQDSDGFWWIMYDPALPDSIDGEYNKVANERQIEAKGREGIDAASGVTEDVSPQELNYVKDVANSLWNKLNVDVHFTKHFFERLNDPRNKKPITPEELVALFRKEYNAYGDKIRDLDDNDQAVLLDLFTKLNVPVVIHHDANSTDMIAKTVMRKPDFKTSDPKFQVETIGWFGSERKKLNEQARKESNEVTKLSKLVEEITKRQK